MHCVLVAFAVVGRQCSEMVHEITSIIPSHPIPGAGPPKREILTQPRWEVYDAIRGVVVDAAVAGGDPAKALPAR